MSDKNEKMSAQPMSLKLPDDLRAEIKQTAIELGETEATVARLSLRRGLKALVSVLKDQELDADAA